MESQPQNPEFRNNPETFTHVSGYFVLFVWFESLHPSQQFTVMNGIGLPGLNQY